MKQARTDAKFTFQRATPIRFFRRLEAEQGAANVRSPL
jgi:hypothetical protein